MPVNVPQSQRRDSTGTLLTIGGAALGAATANPGALGTGAMTGAQAGQIAGSVTQRQASQQAPQIGGQSQAMQRRMQELDQLRRADTAVAQLPPQQQQQYGPAISRARMMAEQEAYA